MNFMLLPTLALLHDPLVSLSVCLSVQHRYILTTQHNIYTHRKPNAESHQKWAKLQRNRRRPVLFLKHALGGCTIDMPSSN